jgi:hypothetical protein
LFRARKTGHPGNLPHKFLASLIGLEAKVQLRGR